MSANRCAFHGFVDSAKHREHVRRLGPLTSQESLGIPGSEGRSDLLSRNASIYNRGTASEKRRDSVQGRGALVTRLTSSMFEIGKSRLQNYSREPES
jgi:hypothetical protein